MTKKAMLDLYKEGFLPHLQVHDELCFSLHLESQSIQQITDIMENAIKLTVPVKVDVSIGANWGGK